MWMQSRLAVGWTTSEGLPAGHAANASLKQTQQSVCGCSHVRGLLFFSVISNVFTLRSVNIGFVNSYVESWFFQVIKILFPAATAARLILFTFQKKK